MHMGIDDVADRQRRALTIAACSARPMRTEPPVSMTATQSRADDEADIGDVVVAGRIQRQMPAEMDKDARRAARSD